MAGQACAIICKKGEHVKSILVVLFAVLAVLPCAKAQVSTGTAFSVAPQLDGRMVDYKCHVHSL